jgi:histone H3/H4
VVREADEDERIVNLVIDEEKVHEAAVERILRDCWGSEYRTGLQERVEETVATMVRESCEELVRDVVAEKVRSVIEEVIAAGFPQYDHWGDRKGPVVSFESYVRKSVEDMMKTRPHGTPSLGGKIAREAFTTHVEKAFKSEMKLIRDKVRGYVDERLAGEVVKSLRDAVGLAK